MGGGAVEEDGYALHTWIKAPDDVPAFLAHAERVLAKYVDEVGKLTWHREEDRDWLTEWRKGLAPRRVGARITVTPTWLEPEASAADIVIRIDPQMAFGTGEHASTRIALVLLETLLRPGWRVLDAGTGSGILAIAAARLGASLVHAVESDADALPNARDNVLRNGAADRVRLIHATVDLQWLSARAGVYDIIAANIISGALRPLLSGFREAMRPGGYLVMCGILRDEADDIRAAACASGLEPEDERFEEDWWGGAFYRPA